MFIGIFIVVCTGNWVIMSYEHVYDFPKVTYVILGVGLVTVLIAYQLTRVSTYNEQSLNKKDNRDYINKLYSRKIADWAVGIAIITLIGAFIHSWDLLFQVGYIYLFFWIAVYGFMYVMKGDRVDLPVDEHISGMEKKIFKYLDYRRHPFSISLVVYLLVVGSFLLSKQFNIPFEITRGNSRYVFSLPSISWFMSGAVLASTYIYIIHHGNLLGIKRSWQNMDKVTGVHFAELIFTGATLLIWLMTVIIAVVRHVQ